MSKITYKDLYTQVSELVDKKVRYRITKEYGNQLGRTSVSPYLMQGNVSQDVSLSGLVSAIQSILDDALPDNIIEGLDVVATDPISRQVTISAGKGSSGGKVYTSSSDITVTIPFDSKTRIFYINLGINTVLVEKAPQDHRLTVAKIIVPQPGITNFVRDTKSKENPWDAYIMMYKEMRFYGNAAGKFEEDSLELLRDNIGDVLADNLIGNIRLSENLKITNTAGTLQLDSDKILLYDEEGNITAKFNENGSFFYDANGTEIAKFSVDEARIGNIKITKNSLESTNFASGALGSGFRINDSGDAEFNNIRARGKLTSTVFEKETISSIGGNLLIADSDILDVDMTALDNSVLTIVGDTTFVVNDILRIKDGIDDEWLQVTALGGEITVKTVSADSEYAGTEAIKAIDNDLNYGWCSEDILTSHWLKCDFGIDISNIINTVKINTWYYTPVDRGIIKDFSIQGSNNDLDWTTIYTGTAEDGIGHPWGSGDDNDWQTFTFENDTIYRYIKIYITSNYRIDGWKGFKEIKFYDNNFSYTVTRDKASTYPTNINPSWKKGTAVVNYGTSGEGLIFMTASESNAPFIDILTHAGIPWSTTTHKVRLGNLAGITDSLYGTLSGYGLYSDNVYLRGKLYAPEIKTAVSGKRLELDTTNGLIGYNSAGDKIFALLLGDIVGIGDAGDIVIGNISGGTNYLWWNNDTGTLCIKGSLAVSSINVGDMGYATDIEFIATGYNSVSWSDGVIAFSDGTQQNIVDGSKNNINGTVYIYYDKSESSSSALLTTTQVTNTVGTDKIILAIIEPTISPSKAIITTPWKGTTIDGEKIVTGCIYTCNGIEISNVPSQSGLNARTAFDAYGIRSYNSAGTKKLDICDGHIEAQDIKLQDPACICCYSFLDAGALVFHDESGNVPYAKRLCAGTANTGASVELCAWKCIPSILVSIKELSSYDPTCSASCQKWCVYNDAPVWFCTSATCYGYCFIVHAKLELSGATEAESVTCINFGACQTLHNNTCCSIVKLKFTAWCVPSGYCCYYYGTYCYVVCYKVSGAGVWAGACSYNYTQAHANITELQSFCQVQQTMCFPCAACWVIMACCTGVSWTITNIVSGACVTCCYSCTRNYGTGLVCTYTCSATTCNVEPDSDSVSCSVSLDLGGTAPGAGYTIYCVQGYGCWCTIIPHLCSQSSVAIGYNGKAYSTAGVAMLIYCEAYTCVTECNCSKCCGVNFAATAFGPVSMGTSWWTAVALCSISSTYADTPVTGQQTWSCARTCVCGLGGCVVTCYCCISCTGAAASCLCQCLHSTADITSASTILDPSGILNWLAIAYS